MAISEEQIRSRLDRIKDSKQREMQMQAPVDYNQFMPATLGSKLRDPSLMYQQINNIGQQGRNATAITQVKVNNLRARNEMLRQQDELKRAQALLEQARQPIDIKVNPGKRRKPIKLIDVPGPRRPNRQPNRGGGGRSQGGPHRPLSPNYTGNRNFRAKFGKDNTPEVSDLKSIHANAPIVSVEWRGRTFNVNRQVAPIFIAFLDDLHKMGYRPVSIGGYNERNIAGTNTRSLHADGLAIDIDPGLNPVQSNDGSMQHALPPKISALATKYGLQWGGDWSGYKDPMHFSVAHGGRE